MPTVLTTVEEALSYIQDRAVLIAIDALSTRDIADALVVWRTNERTTAGDQLLIEAVNQDIELWEVHGI